MSFFKNRNRIEGLGKDESFMFIVEDQELYEAGKLVEINGHSHGRERRASHRGRRGSEAGRTGGEP